MLSAFRDKTLYVSADFREECMRYKVFDVFARAPLEGNPTGIVYYEGPEDTSLMQRLAAEFPVPDTLFFTRKTSAASLFACRAFSPYEELVICAQGLIGGMYALLEDTDKCNPVNMSWRPPWEPQGCY